MISGTNKPIFVMDFVMDTDAFIGPYRSLQGGVLGFDVAPSFWRQLQENVDLGRIRSIDKVLGELMEGNIKEEKIGNRRVKKVVDELAIWANEKINSAFRSTDDAEVNQVYARMMQWVNDSQQFNAAAKAEFARKKNADGWLVAYAKVKGFIVVTGEKKNFTIKKKVPIPNVCEEFKVRYVDLATMMRELSIKL